METINDALIQAVKACGGSKTIGAMLWPELLADAAQRKLLDCLNPERPHHLNPEQAAFILRQSRQAGAHDAMRQFAALCGYQAPAPVTLQDEKAELHRRVLAMGAKLQALMVQVAGQP